MGVALAMTAVQKGIVLLLITGVAAPIAGLWFLRSGDSWRMLGRGPFSIEPEKPAPNRLTGASAPVDPAIQAAEVRQMLEAKAARQKARGEEPMDVEEETARLLETAAERPPADERMEAELRTEVRQLVVARNERRRRQGLDPLDIEAETERQLADLVG